MHTRGRSQVATLRVEVVFGDRRGEVFDFQNAFEIGRGEQCALRLEHHEVSRRHLAFEPRGAAWLATDRGSTNGTFCEGKAVGALFVNRELSIQLGKDGPILELRPLMETVEPDPVAPEAMVPEPGEAVATPSEEEAEGDEPLLADEVIEHTTTPLERRYQAAVAVLLLVVAVLAVAVSLQQNRLTAMDDEVDRLFFLMKDLELQQAKARLMEEESVVLKFGEAIRQARMAYITVLEQSGLDQAAITYEDQLILRVARAFGEQETNIPEEFVEEVKTHIKEWESGSRLENGIRKAKRLGYIDRIKTEFEKVGLPPQYLYIALQESAFNTRAVGPELPEPMFYAKGMWQFIPSTAKKMGLEVGDQISVPIYDEADERFDFERSTIAVARYLRALYDSEAGASGLLVLACYNWGEVYVMPRIREFPSDPRDRNFWAVFLAGQHYLPPETRQYIFHIFSAAVIGEDPRYFGFDMDPPLDD